MNIFFQQNKNEFKNIISDVMGSYEKEEKINLYKNINNLCQTCIKTIFIEGGLSNILDKNKLNNDELKLLFSDNKNIEEIINEIKKDMEDIIIKDEKKLEINIMCKIIQMKNKIVKCYDKLKENNIYLEKNINKNDNELEFEDSDKDDDDINENDNDKNYNERKFNIDNTNRVLFPGKSNTNFDLSKKKYTIFSKGKIYESKYESIPKSKLSKTFLFNSPTQIKNYIYNLPVLITNNSNIILKESNDDKKKDKIIYTLSDIKNLESKSNLRKSAINSIITPVKFQTLEIEKQILKLKEMEKEKEKLNEKDNNFQNLYNKNDEIQNNNSKIELNENKIKNMKDNNDVNDTTLNNNNYINNKYIDNFGYENKNNIIGTNNNNNLQMDNNANLDYNLLFKFLLSTSLINKRLLRQIILGNEQTNLIPGISNKILLEHLINNNNDGNMNNNIISNINNSCPILNDIQNNDNSNLINSINQNLNSLNNINENLNLSNEKNIFNDAKNTNILPSYGICNNIQPFYNSSLLNRNNINTFTNEISFDKNNLIRNSLDSLNDLLGINAPSGNLNMSSNNQIKTDLNNFNFGLNQQNII